jgi:hypothetical protein
MTLLACSYSHSEQEGEHLTRNSAKASYWYKERLVIGPYERLLIGGIGSKAVIGGL